MVIGNYADTCSSYYAFPYKTRRIHECLLFDCFNMLCIDCHENKYIDCVGRCCYSLNTGIFVRLSERVDYVSEIPQIRSI
jgi:hypothetical protein